MRLDYSTVHWGDSPTSILDARVWDYGNRCASAGRCVAISYRASKRGTFHTWRHSFHHRPQLLLTGSPSGAPPERARKPPADAIAIGWLVDLELEDGRRVHTPGHLVVTDSEGSSIWLAAIGTQPKIALEQLHHGPIVTAHGIER